MQLEDENESKYFINYISDEGEESTDHSVEQSHAPTIDEDHDLDLSELPNSLIITSVPQDLFTNQEMKVNQDIPYRNIGKCVLFFQNEFEQLFRAHDPEIVVLYLKFFQRVRITFTSSYNALQARLHLHEFPFHGCTIKTYFASVNFLFLIGSSIHR